METLQDVCLIKIGGSALTNKEKPGSLNEDVLARLTEEIADTLGKHPSLKIILGHGNGSFGHSAAKMALARDGSYTETGAREVRAATAALSTHVQDSLKKLGLTFGYFPPHQHLRFNQTHEVDGDFDSLIGELKDNQLVVTHGELLDNELGGYKVCSTEELLSDAVTVLHETGQFRVRMFLILGSKDGVLDVEGAVLQELADTLTPHVPLYRDDTRIMDVSGKMASKVRHAHRASKRGAESVVIASGLNPGLLGRALQGEEVPGTKVSYRP